MQIKNPNHPEIKEASEINKMPELKEAFKERYKELLNERYEEFIKYSTTYIRKSIRTNTLKKTKKEIITRINKEWHLEEVPWCPEGFWITYKDKKRFDIGNLPEHQLGYIYVQDAASMIPPVVLKPEPGDIILDLWAAPGSKTTQIAQYMNNQGLIIANDSQGKRLSALGINLQRCGVTNTIITKMDGERIRGQELFDKILLDAPCSGTGTIRRSYKIAEMWSPGLVDRMAKIQYKLLKNAYRLLKKGGILVYSTCTLEPKENEGIIHQLLKENPDAKLLNIDLNIKRSPAITKFQEEEYDEEIKKCLRIYPQDNDTEGFFVAKITKT